MNSFINIDDVNLIDRYKLSHAEIKVLQLLMEGFKRKKIAEQLNSSVHTVNSHVENIYKKLGVHNEAAAVVKLFSEFLITNNNA